MNKKELRKKYKELREKLSSDEIADMSLAIANKCLELPIWQYTTYQLFLTIEEHKEVNTEFLLQILFGKDKNVVISQSHFEDSTMSHFLLTDNTIIKKNKWNIPEPINGIPIQENIIDVVFVPLLAFDSKGNRVGYGKGFYDTFLKACKPEVVKVGLSFFAEEKNIMDVSPLDIPLDYVVTPSYIYQFIQNKN